MLKCSVRGCHRSVVICGSDGRFLCRFHASLVGFVLETVVRVGASIWYWLVSIASVI